MPKWQRHNRNPAGEWAVSDVRRGYRICSYHREAHGGVHVHFPLEAGKAGEVRRVDIANEREAEAIKRTYAADHEGFTWAEFAECVTRWRSSYSSE